MPLYKMPEGPEVRIITENIRRLKLNNLKHVKILSGKYKRNPPVGFTAFNKLLRNTYNKTSIHSKGKFIWFDVNKENYIWITLGLTGNLSQTKNSYSRLRFTFAKKSIYFNDMRNFGTVKFIFGSTATAKLDKKLKSLGFDITHKKITSSILSKILKGSKNIKSGIPDFMPIAKFLLNQSKIAGVGNYIRAEVIFKNEDSQKDVIEKFSKYPMEQEIDCYYDGEDYLEVYITKNNLAGYIT